jgi:hypothetical protein
MWKIQSSMRRKREAAEEGQWSAHSKNRNELTHLNGKPRLEAELWQHFPLIFEVF